MHSKKSEDLHVNETKNKSQFDFLNDLNCRYFRKVCTIFENGCLVQVYSSALTILLCLFVAKTSTWFVVYLIAVSGSYQLTVYCAIGTLIEYKVIVTHNVQYYSDGRTNSNCSHYFINLCLLNYLLLFLKVIILDGENKLSLLNFPQSEEISKFVYDIPFYNLTVKEQLMFKFLLQHVQKTITITVLGERKLNIQTGCAVCCQIFLLLQGKTSKNSFRSIKRFIRRL